MNDFGAIVAAASLAWKSTIWHSGEKQWRIFLLEMVKIQGISLCKRVADLMILRAMPMDLLF
jgi:hypothetical protein